MVGLVLQRLREQSLAAQVDGAPVEVGAGHARPRVAEPREAEPGHGEAALVDGFGVTAHLDELGVEHIPDDAVDVVAEGLQPDTDLRCGYSGAAGNLDGVEEVGDEHPDPGVDRRDGVGGAAQHGVAEEADGADGHGSAQTPRRSGMPSATSAASSRAADRVRGRNEAQLMTDPAARCSS